MGFFGKKKPDAASIVLLSPFEGTAVALEDVPDEAFAQKLIGEGIAVAPSNGTVQTIFNAPVNIFKTGHAFSYDLDGLEIIVHIGIETVGLKGSGFRALQESDGTYPVGTPLLEVDIKAVEGAGCSMVSPIVVATMDLVASVKLLVRPGDTVRYGQPLFEITRA